MQASARVGASAPVGRRPVRSRGRPVARPQAAAGVRTAGGVVDAVLQGYVSDGVITREEATSMSADQLEFLIRKRTRNSPAPPPAARAAPAAPSAGAGLTSVQSYVADGTITADEAASMSSTQLEFLIRKRTRADGGGPPAPAPGASSSVVSFRPSSSRDSSPISRKAIGSTPVAGGLGVDEAELSPEQLELLQEYIRIKEQEEALQAQEALLQQQVASLKNEVEELEGSSGTKGTNVFRDAPPLRDNAKAAPRTQQQQQAGAAASQAEEGSSSTPWAAVAAGAVALVGLSASIYFAPENLFKGSKPAAPSLQQRAPATAPTESARLIDRPADVPGAALSAVPAAEKAAQDAKKEAAAATEAKAAAEAKAATEAKAAQAAAQKAAESKAAAEVKMAAEAKAAADAKAAAESRAAQEAAKKAAESRAAFLAESRAAAEAKAVAESKAAEAAKVAASEREEVKLATALGKAAAEKQAAAPAPSASAPSAAAPTTWRSFFGQQANKPAEYAVPAAVGALKAADKPAGAPLTLSKEALDLQSKLRGEPAAAAAKEEQSSFNSLRFPREAGALLAAGAALAAGLAVRSGTRNPANLLRTAEGRVTSLRETLEVQAVDLKAAQDRVVAAQAEYARGLSGLRSANAELQALSSRVLSSEKAANALVKDLAKLESKDAIKLRSEAASIAAQVTKQREVVASQVAKQRQVVEAALNKALSELSA
ncbi:microtubule-associated futsch-like isoform A [Micractinium conductrix]|uniref:Microtubule-associated futsch-like isoform A n=1 Tax=Micractinium conductrix TaxID=554055 RepID=A0A2P6VEA0_9CHLO|nr:microtubule-associated futsch-like isoform A [Micractinium conductrix]|eukprot:PSC72423.1 microtubule-associated futsch-like isoform A [Micractinium conductrix]